ncbi:hypothetical protein OG802_34395 [Streptomyces sp. NBC_00704]|uniref:hypothetical protein n=1 Tax=Streptomyces sp. NBC_00704 TaxID=2975809 RepID=UPI002E31111F|nr:hypothetical protein [Streptomyces sp. NBC_00704]
MARKNSRQLTEEAGHPTPVCSTSYVPDSRLTANGWIDPLTLAACNPANNPLHG